MKNEMPTRMTIAPTAIAAIPAPLTLLEPAVVVVCRTVGALVVVVGVVPVFWGRGPNGFPAALLRHCRGGRGQDGGASPPRRRDYSHAARPQASAL